MVILLILAPLALLNGFFFYAGVLQAWGEMRWYVRVVVSPALLVFGGLDVLFRFTIGALVMLDIDHGFTFSQLCCYWYRIPCWRGDVSGFVASILNEISPGHIS